MSSENRRNKLVLTCLLGVWLLVLGRAGYVQLVRWQYYRAKALDQHTDSLRLAPDRGRVFDCRGRALTLNLTSSLVYVWPEKVRHKDSLATILARAGLGTREEVRRDLDRHKEMFCFKRRLEQPTADTLWRRIVKHRFGDCTAIEKESRRFYPFDMSCANVVGFAGEERGLAGVETWYDSVLAGQPGWVLMLRDASGLDLPYPSYPRVEPVPGADIHLTLDTDVQEICFRALAGGVARTRAKQGSAVVLDARDGAILALASYPSYDPARFRQYPTLLYKCAPVCDEFEPGSSFKIVVAATALESPNAAVLIGQRFDVSSGFIEVMGRKISDAHKHGVLDFDGLLVQSSNPGCALLALQLDRTRFHLMARSLGFGTQVGVGLPGEANGHLDRPAKLNALRLTNNAFGQGVTVTLLQMAAAYQCIANNGYYTRPYLVRTVRAGRRVLRHSGPVAGRPALGPGTVARLKEILAKVVTEGTGKLAAVPGVDVCGKTGTAQKTEPGGGYSQTRSMMTFVGFFPKERPRYVVAVDIDEPGTERFASTSVCPVFREIAGNVLALERVRQNEGLAQAPGGKPDRAGRKPGTGRRGGTEEIAGNPGGQRR